MGSLGENIRRLREKNGISQVDFAKKINIGNTTLSQYESGTRTPSDEIKIKIADYFGVSVDHLLGREEHTPTLDEQLEGVDFALSGEIRDLNDAEKQDILDYIRFKKQQKKGE